MICRDLSTRISSSKALCSLLFEIKDLSDDMFTSINVMVSVIQSVIQSAILSHSNRGAILELLQAITRLAESSPNVFIHCKDALFPTLIQICNSLSDGDESFETLQIASFELYMELVTSKNSAIFRDESARAAELCIHLMSQIGEGCTGFGGEHYKISRPESSNNFDDNFLSGKAFVHLLFSYRYKAFINYLRLPFCSLRIS